MNREQENIKAFQALNQALIRNLLANPQTRVVRASGRFESFFQSASSVEISGNRFVKYSVPYTPYIDAGKPKGWSDVRELYEWVGLKKYGISYANNRERRGIAYAIARKHAKEGSYKFRNKSERTEIAEQTIAQSLPSFYEQIGRVQTRWVNETIAKEIQEINKLR